MLFEDKTQPPRKRAEDLLARLTLREKVGQVNQRLFGFAIYSRKGEDLELVQEFRDEVERYGGLGLLYGLYRADPWSQKDFENGLHGLWMKRAYNQVQRYVVEHSGELPFPFKRWQIQKVWRGERPQEGRFREFVQADIDVVGEGTLPEHYEVELPLVMVGALEELRQYGLPKATVHANNRKLSEGFYRGLGLTDIEGVLREIDKLDKVGADEVVRLLVTTCGASEDQARACLELAGITAADGGELIDRFNGLCEIHHIDMDGEDYAMAKEGLDTLTMIVDEAAHIRPGSVIADLKIARGLDYYTGSVYETFLDGADSLGSICSGGRYDNLASQGNRTYPGVGLSIGLSRLVSYMLHSAGATASRVSPACVLVAVWNEENRGDSNAIARALRARGIAADVAPTAAKLGKQIKYADKLGIPYVWFPNEDPTNDGPDEVKNIVTGEQVGADAQSWEPDTVYAQQTVAVAGSARS